MKIVVASDSACHEAIRQAASMAHHMLLNLSKLGGNDAIKLGTLEGMSHDGVAFFGLMQPNRSLDSVDLAGSANQRCLSHLWSFGMFGK